MLQRQLVDGLVNHRCLAAARRPQAKRSACSRHRRQPGFCLAESIMVKLLQVFVSQALLIVSRFFGRVQQGSWAISRSLSGTPVGMFSVSGSMLGIGTARFGP